MSDNVFWATCWAFVSSAVIGVAWAVAWANVNMPQPSAEQLCARNIYQSDFCSKLLKDAAANVK